MTDVEGLDLPMLGQRGHCLSAGNELVLVAEVVAELVSRSCVGTLLVREPLRLTQIEGVNAWAAAQRLPRPAFLPLERTPSFRGRQIDGIWPTSSLPVRPGGTTQAIFADGRL